MSKLRLIHITTFHGPEEGALSSSAIYAFPMTTRDHEYAMTNQSNRVNAIRSTPRLSPLPLNLLA